MPELLDNAHLEQTAVVANSAMNRDRRLSARLPSRTRLRPVAWLAAHPAPQHWLDVGCGSAHALFESDETQTLSTARSRRLTRSGRALPRWEFTYAGADAHVGPNYTGRDAVASHYRL
ncbi:hypothetical protein [Nocardia sp. NPDC051981]|uniref:hypothetical protein n=1 Tax=Nocardia sp. NPDC051981 TaxID=3155417 RepID=UPI0034340061